MKTLKIGNPLGERVRGSRQKNENVVFTHEKWQDWSSLSRRSTGTFPTGFPYRELMLKTNGNWLVPMRRSRRSLVPVLRSLAHEFHALNGPTVINIEKVTENVIFSIFISKRKCSTRMMVDWKWYTSQKIWNSININDFYFRQDIWYFIISKNMITVLLVRFLSKFQVRAFIDL